MKKALHKFLIGIVAASLPVLTAWSAELVLFDFEDGIPFTAIKATGAKASETKTDLGSALQVSTGHDEPWPGVAFSPSGGRWDLSTYGRLECHVRNTGTQRVTVSCRVDNPGADGRNHCVTGSVSLEPGATQTIRVPLKRTGGDTLGDSLFGLRGYPVALGGTGTIDPSNITRILLFVGKPDQDHQFEVDAIRAMGSWTRPTAWTSDANPYFPLIDTFGQYRHKDWPGKVHSSADLEQRRTAESTKLSTDRGPQGWNVFGGWVGGPTLKATGFFRVEKHRGKWWFVDPEGRLFWSHGIDCVGMTDATPIAEREHWFEQFPGDQPDFSGFLTRSSLALKGHYAGQRPKCFSFARTNFKRKYGDDWRKVLPEVMHRRLRSWGLNTIGNWSDEEIRLLRRTPYTDNVSSRRSKMIEGSEGYWGKFPDVFDSSFRAALQRSMASRKDKSAGDPWCIGYFSDNELSWGDGISLAIATLKSPADQAAKQEFVADLRASHGDITKLNSIWGTQHESWDALLTSRTPPDTKKAGSELEAFEVRIAEKYFRTVRDVTRKFAPNQLYLGCRFAWANARAAAAAAKFCDVVSYNLYRRSVADFSFNGGVDVPLLIGEFHFGALDRGLFHTGLVAVENQAARAQAYVDYVRGALQHPRFIGTHWFQYQDEPTTGRVYDEENYQIGFVDIADTPYAEITASSRALAEKMYRTRLEE